MLGPNVLFMGPLPSGVFPFCSSLLVCLIVLASFPWITLLTFALLVLHCSNLWFDCACVFGACVCVCKGVWVYTIADVRMSYILNVICRPRHTEVYSCALTHLHTHEGMERWQYGLICRAGTLQFHLLCLDRLPLGVPSFLLMGSLELAQDLIRKPSSSRATGAAAEREAGYVLLGSACACLPADMLKVSASTYVPLRIC
jgi:hypothetical protein